MRHVLTANRIGTYHAACAVNLNELKGISKVMRRWSGVMITKLEMQKGQKGYFFPFSSQFKFLVSLLHFPGAGGAVYFLV